MAQVPKFFCSSIRTWVWNPSIHVKTRHGNTICNPSAGQAETGGSLELTGQTLAPKV